MKSLSYKLVALLALIVLTLPYAALAQDDGSAGKPHPEIDMQEMMRIWQEVATPGEQHRYMDNLVGRWKTKTRVWMQGPGSPPMETEGTAEYKWILDGHYMLMETDGELMGQPHQGMGLMGYDNYRKQYTNTWLDNMSTAVYSSCGNFDPSGKVLTMYGSMDEPMTGEIGKTSKYVVRIIDDNKHIFEIHDPIFGEGKTKVMEMVYTRI